MPTPTIPAGNLFMNATLYTGTGTTAQNIVNGVSGQSFQPDLVWVKNRSTTADHQLIDSVRGVNIALQSNQTNAEANFGSMPSFNSNGFQVVAGGGGAFTGTNNSGSSFVGWQWKAGGTAVTNTAGSITSSVSANTTSGFSVVTYTGTGANATVGHGLGVAPSFMIFKQRNNAGTSWQIYHSSLGATQALDFTTASAGTTINYWNNTAPTSTVATIGISVGANQNTGTYVAYCWTPIAGYSAFGSYTGNGSTDGTFVYTGFRPKFVMVKCSSNSTGSTVWSIFDTSRSPYNAAVLELYPNSSAAEGTDSNGMDILSNGFKPRRNSEYLNNSGWTYIYMAVAENPFKFSNAR